MQRSAVLKSAGVDLGELKTFFRQQKRRSSCVGLGVLHAGPLLPPSPAAPAVERPLAPLGEGGASASDEWADASAGQAACSPVARASSPFVAAAASPRVEPRASLDGKATTAAAAAVASENDSPNVAMVGAVHARDASDESAGMSGGSNKKLRRRRRQSFNLSELDQRLREIAESGASPCPPMHGMPSPMIPMTTPTTPHATPALAAGAAEAAADTPAQPRMLAAESPFARATPSASGDWRGAGALAMAVDDDDLEAYAPAELAPFEPPSEPRGAAGTPLSAASAPRAAAPATPAAASPCVDLALARTHAPLSTCDHVVAHVRGAARTTRLGCAAAVDALAAVVREVATFAELWHWDEETRLAVRAADDERGAARAARVRFSAMDAASLEPPAWSDDSCEVQRAALDAMLPVMRACSELPARLAAVPAAKLRRFLEAAAAAIGADATLRPSGAGAFWREQLRALARGELLYGARCGSLVRSLVRHELRALAARNEAGEAHALRTMPSPRAGPVLHADADSVARVLSNALRVWEGSREMTVDPAVTRAFAAAAQPLPSSARSGADVVRESLPVDALVELLRAADAHTALSHLVMGCAFIRAASADEAGPLRQLLELAPLVPGWIDEFALLADLPRLDRELAHARAICRSARDLFPHGAVEPAPASD